MGLDMYLVARSKNGGATRQICYWRKANAILNWFDHNLESVKTQGNGPASREGVRNATDYIVTKKEYEKILDDCRRLLLLDYEYEGTDGEVPIPEDLLPMSGFFFGSQKLDEWFWCEIEATVGSLGAYSVDWDNEIVEFWISY